MEDGSMEIIKDVEEINNLADNKVIGTPVMNSSVISFAGKNNILVCEENVRLHNSKITFHGNNSVVYLSSNRHIYYVDISLYFNSAMYFGADNYFNGPIHIVISEETNVVFGKEGLCSFGVWLRTADPHLVYDCDSHKRINPSKSIFVGDHVWIGQDVLLLKGANICSGSIISAKSCVTSKTIPSNTVFGGVPARLAKENVFWRGDCVHTWTKKKTKKNQIDDSDIYIFEYNEEEYLPFHKIDAKLKKAADAQERLDVLNELMNRNEKNRFAKKETAAPAGGWFSKLAFWR